ncbi:type II secretion system F family protein [Aestuariirhabdus litorea]|uniref:Type II secretion system F family protein n=1 Tax=Aestuariirhabdus litorea TaxID=2528527 RepID=A0A3P3VMK3_9GAMM|nr:type II secretion system F family protein [Aestuariirhabdus litorea]RRJ83118.1 type II secretion system F family protein [Aestuariirhabdus litorea]RWW93274.1 type II secretion system F family protein [Endozoicomonadaceae bacterium GTF-13]
MANFSWRGRDAQGAEVSGEREAPSADVVARQLGAEQIVPLAIVEVASSSGGGIRLEQLFAKRRVELDELVIFSRQMYSLTKAGVPIIRAMRGLQNSARSPLLAEVLGRVADDLESGMSLAGALQQHPRVFSPMFINMIHVGENTGRLDRAFHQLSEYLEMERETRKRIKQATRYPMLVVVAMAVALAVVNFLVIPSFSSVFAKLGADLPWPTLVLIATSNFFVHYWWLMLLVMAAAGVAGWRYLQTEAGALRWDRYRLRLPLVGPIFERIALGRFARTFSMMVSAGVPMMQVLGIVARTVGNKHIGAGIESMRNGVERGESLLRTAANTQLFSPLVLQMLAVGEETGAIDELFEEVADFYDQEVDYDLRRLADAIEPILIVALGVMVLILALGVFLPVWELGAVVRN